MDYSKAQSNVQENSTVGSAPNNSPINGKGMKDGMMQINNNTSEKDPSGNTNDNMQTQV